MSVVLRERCDGALCFSGCSNPLKDEVAVVDEKAELKKEMKSDEEALMKAAPTDEADVKVPSEKIAPVLMYRESTMSV